MSLCIVGLVAHLTRTPYGTIDTDLARAVHQSIAINAAAALLALNNVHYHLGIAYTTSGAAAASDPPTQRWSELIRSLFDTQGLPWPIPRAPRGTGSSGVRVVVPASDTAGSLESVLSTSSDSVTTAIVKVLIEAGTFLVAESVELFGQLELAEAVQGEDLEGFGNRDFLVAQLDEAASAGRTLIDHAESGKLEILLFGISPTKWNADVARQPVLVQPKNPARGHEADPPYLHDYLQPAAKILNPPTLNGGVVVVVGDPRHGKSASAFSLLFSKSRSVLFHKERTYRAANKRAIAYVLSAVDGRQSKPIPMAPDFGPYRDAATPMRWLGHALTVVEEQLEALSEDHLYSDADLVDCDSLQRWVDIAEVMDFAIRRLRADHIIVVGGGWDRIWPNSLGDTTLSSQHLIDELRSQKLIPDFSQCAITVVDGAGRTGTHAEDGREYWLQLCSAGNALSCEFDLAGIDVSASSEFEATSRSVSGGACRSEGSAAARAAVGVARGEVNRTSSIAALIEAAVEDDQRAWNELIDRYTPLVLSVIDQYQLRPADAAEVNQRLWLGLVKEIERVVDHPDALPDLITTTTHNECLRMEELWQNSRPFAPKVTHKRPMGSPASGDGRRVIPVRAGYALLDPQAGTVTVPTAVPRGRRGMLAVSAIVTVMGVLAGVLLSTIGSNVSSSDSVSSLISIGVNASGLVAGILIGGIGVHRIRKRADEETLSLCAAESAISLSSTNLGIRDVDDSGSYEKARSSAAGQRGNRLGVTLPSVTSSMS